jgi:hypothetical protein
VARPGTAVFPVARLSSKLTPVTSPYGGVRLQQNNYYNDAAALIQNKKYIRIEGFTFDGSTGASIINVIHPSGDKNVNPIQGIEIVNNTFTNNGNTGVTSGTMTVVIELYDTGREHSYTGATVNKITGNTFTNNYGVMIDMAAAASDTLLPTILRATTREA